MLDTREKECVNSDTTYCRVRILSEPKVPADPLLDKRLLQRLREPKDIYGNGIMVMTGWE